jgi:hypothetical protein
MKFVNESTKGATLNDDDTEVITLRSDDIETTQSPEDESKPSDWLTSRAKELGSFIVALSEKVAFVGLIIAIVGYIIISSSGEMNSTGEYWRYIVFLFISFLFYKLFNIKTLPFKLEGINTRLMIIIILLIIVLIVSNREIILWLLSQINNHLQINNTKII